jgi:hypothetical protein
MTAQKISSEGGVLGKQLIAVLFEDRAKSQIAPGDSGVVIKPEAITYV